MDGDGPVRGPFCGRESEAPVKSGSAEGERPLFPTNAAICII